MKRSRRSLSLLLGMMAMSLAVVRATTQPANETGRTGVRENSPKLTASPSSLRLTPRARAAPKSQDSRGVAGETKPQLRRRSLGRAASGLHGITRRIRRVLPRVAVDRADGPGPAQDRFGQDAETTKRPVSATAIIVLISDSGEAPAPRIGWSGCGAYAVGCDHLGRLVPDREDDAVIGGLMAPRF
jgi:hypothetical protein